MGVCLYTSVHHMYAVPIVVREGIKSSVPGVIAAMRVLGTKPGSSAIAMSILTHGSSRQLQAVYIISLS